MRPSHLAGARLKASQCAHAQLKVFFIQHHRNLDSEEIMRCSPFLASAPEHGRGDAGMRAHADPDQGNLHNLVVT
jgi:hypothetical protein